MKIKTPDWVKQAVFYQIFPDRFAVGKQLTRWQAQKLEAWGDKPTLQGYKGGNLWGVCDRLDYLQDLGINAIYLTPIFQSAANHRYHTHDYYQVDPLLGGNEAFQALLKAAHQRDIKVLLDGVFNHASRGFFFFNDILENGPFSPWLDWFLIEKWPISAYDGSKPANYVSWVGNRALPKFNHENPQVREYIMQVGEYWLNQGIDGWRLDVPDQIQVPDFWQEFRSRVKAINPEAYIVGEIWEDARQWLDGTQFDGVMNYLFTVPTIAFIAGDRLVKKHVAKAPYKPYPPIDAAEYAQKIQDLLDLYPWEIQQTQLNLLSSHDTARFLSIAGEDIDSLKLATLLLFTFPGAPSIYYGDEVGLVGESDPDSRRSFPETSAWNQDLLEYHRGLIKLRHTHPALSLGDYQIIFAQGQVYVFTRTLAESKILVVVNGDRQPGEIQLNQNELSWRPETILWGEARLNWLERELKLFLSSRSAVILS